MITRLFPERNRRQIKLKFVKEERVAPNKVTDHLIRKTKPVGKWHAELFDYHSIQPKLIPPFFIFSSRFGPLYERYGKDI
jgi:Myb DNA-binding like